MLDENLPSVSLLPRYIYAANHAAFFLKQNNSSKHLWSVYFCQHGNEPFPNYTLRYPDPASSASKNRYAVALCDPYVPDVVYGEVLITPEWTQPNLSPDAIHQNGGTTPPPEPILPSRFTIQLYNPDQKITVSYRHKSWNTPSWEFEMPQYTFRQPSSSTLDHALNDPAVAEATPKLKFSWRKEKLSKGLTCLLSGKTTTIPELRTKKKEPDITISIYKALRELTLYEPNLYRVEMEDFKGLEVVLLLGAVTIRDVYFTSSVREAFHVTNGPVRSNAQPAAVNKPSKPSQQPQPPTASGAVTTAGPAGARPQPRITIPQCESRPPPPEQRPQRSQAEIDAENARRRKQQEIKSQEEARRSKKLLEAEEKLRRKEQEKIDKETRRLQKLYGREEAEVRAQTPAQPKPRPPARPNQPPRPDPRFYDPRSRPPASQPAPMPSPYLQAPGHDRRHHSVVQFAPPQPQSSGAMYGYPQPGRQGGPSRVSSFLGLRRAPGPEDGKLTKKRSSVF